MQYDDVIKRRSIKPHGVENEEGMVMKYDVSVFIQLFYTDEGKPF